MNIETAKRLNTLRTQAQPITPSDPSARSVAAYSLAAQTQAHFAALVEPIFARHEAAAIEQEIRDAASAGRAAETYRASNFHDGTEMTAVPNYGYTPTLWRIAGPEVAAAITADNEARAARYESYRRACEQGVAIPPAV